ncbi:MAG: glycogen synthase GlgA [Epulopiscium sp.]|nr:glycogen synthase GlgA [Candidatus Epulonipiscium sp.]
MKILYATAESSPFIKTGGLADVAGSLPFALKKQGHDVRVVMPLYSGISKTYRKDMKKVGEFYIDLGWRHQYVGVLSYIIDYVTYYFIDNEYYFKRGNIYGEYDDGERFIYFNKAIAVMLKTLDFKVDIIHSNDWHTGLLPLYIQDFSGGDPFYKNMKTVHTIHNLKYQGVFPKWMLEDIAGLSMQYYNEGGVRFFDNMNMMKAGIVYSDATITVSKTYAEEIQYSYYGEMLEDVIRGNRFKLQGIVNGIDYDLFNPETDRNLLVNYNINTLEKKAENKIALQKLYNLPINKDVPVVAMVTRLVAMKGLDLVRHILHEMLQEDIQFVLLGTGDQEYEDLFYYFQTQYPNKVASRIYFNEKESHLIYAGADIFLMPSLAEPCGISQLISLRYGTVPVVRETGGLKDTITPYNEYTNEGNGFSFQNQNAHELLFVIKLALQLYKDQEKWRQLQIRGMESKNDWEQSSKEYTQLYKSLIT